MVISVWYPTGLLSTCRTVGQLLFGDTGHPLEVVVAGVAEVRGAEAEENSHRAAVPTFIFQEVCAVFGAHLETIKEESSGEEFRKGDTSLIFGFQETSQ